MQYLTVLFSLVGDVVVRVIAHCICKWLDAKQYNDTQPDASSE